MRGENWAGKVETYSSDLRVWRFIVEVFTFCTTLTLNHLLFRVPYYGFLI